jgi:23S rRNA (cytosine1962-C5)-methyltransferase
MNQLTLTLKRRESRRLKAGHPWVFANEVERVEPDLVDAGLCQVVDDSGRALGLGYYNRHSLICARLLTRDVSQSIDGDFFRKRLESARKRRQALFGPGEAYRWVYGEADGLPGLVVDSYPGALVIQVTTRGMELLAPLWEEPLFMLAGDVQRIYRNDAGLRGREDLPTYIAYPDGLPPVFCDFEEAGAPVVAIPWRGQKTGYFLDQRDNRIWARCLAPGARVLDLYSYTGAWGLSLLHGGARDVTFVDSSMLALDGARQAVGRGGWESQCRFIRSDAERLMSDLRKDEETFDIVCVDPPDLVPTRKSLGPGRRRLLQIMTSAMQLVAPEGHAVFSCCSFHLDADDFQGLLREASKRAERRVAVIWTGSAAPDHPRPVALPEADYLKCAVCRVE